MFGGGPIGTVMPHTGSIAWREAAFTAGRARLPSRTAAMSSAAMDTAISAGVLAPMGNPTGVCIRARSASESSSSFRIEAPRTLLATKPIYPTPLSKAARIISASGPPWLASTTAEVSVRSVSRRAS